MISLKDDTVSLSGLQPQMLFACLVVDNAFAHFGYNAIITSANDGQHSAKSLHYAGAALDFRVKHVEDDEALLHIMTMIEAGLKRDFDVVLEGEGTDNAHLHIEWQPRRRKA